MVKAPLIPQTYTNPGPPPTPVKTMTRWSQFLGSIAAGEGVQESMMKHYMTRADIEACVRESPDERARWNEARIAARKRTWSVIDIEEILEDISSGTPIVEAVNKIKPGSHAFKSFTDLCCSDPELHAQYLRALKSRAVLLGEDVLRISDGDGTPDTCTTDKGGEIPNNAKVNRDKLRVDARTRLMSAWFPKLFGEKKDTQVNVQIVNHAQRLEEARQRRDTREVAPRVSTEVIEAAFRPLLGKDDTTSAQVDTSGWDDVPRSTVWRETE